MLFIAIAAAVAVTVIGGGLLMRGLLQDREPTEVAADPVTPAPLAGWPGSLTVAVPAAGGTGDEWALASILADELGIAVEIDRLDGEAAVVDALRNQDADIGLLGPLTYVGATDDGVQILPVGIEAANASDTGYVRTFGITQASNAGIDSLEDAAGQVVCFADRSSTAGYQFPAAGLLEAGIDVGAQPSEVAGDHEAAVEFVANGTCPVGFALEEAVAGLVASGAVSGVVDATGGGDDINPAGAELKIIWKSDPITSDPMVVGTWLPQDLQDLIVDIVAEKANRDWAVGNGYCAAVSACTVNGGDAWGYMPATDADFEGYRQVCRLPELNGCELSSLG
jgi:phosphonate transport system substrate-binding protein